MDDPRRDPQVGVWRNGVMVMNLAHFSLADDNLSKQARAIELMNEIYPTPVDSQSAAAESLVRANEALAPYMFYEAMKTGHALITKAIKESGMVGLSGGPSQWGDSVELYERNRRKELFALFGPKDRMEGVEQWLAEFNNDGDELMFHAAVAGQKDIIIRLLELGFPPTSATKLYSVPLHAACANGHMDCVEVLVASGLDINFRDDHGGTPLMRAAVKGETDIVRWLLANGADPKIRETREGNWNALEFGAGRDVEITKMLLNACGWSPAALMAAASFGNGESFDLIARAADFPNPTGLSLDRTFWMDQLSARQREGILGAIEQGGSGHNEQMLSFLLSFVPPEIVADTDVAMSIKNSARRAACGDHADSVKLLLDYLKEHLHDSEVLTDVMGEMLFDAAENSAINTTKLLIDNFGADVNFLEKTEKMSALHYATIKDQPEQIELLVRDYHANIHQAGGKFANGPTPLWYAVNGQLEKATRVLLAYGGPVETIDSRVVAGPATRRVYISASREARAPVKLRLDFDPAWDDEHSAETFLCLEYPEGWPGGVQLRRSDAELNDGRELRVIENRGFLTRLGAYMRRTLPS